MRNMQHGKARRPFKLRTSTQAVFKLVIDWLPMMLPALLFVAFIDYTAWCAWWV
jgi:hypothetical protein